MTKLLQALLLIVVAAFAAQTVLAAVEPLIPYAIGVGILVLGGGAWL